MDAAYPSLAGRAGPGKTGAPGEPPGSQAMAVAACWRRYRIRRAGRGLRPPRRERSAGAGFIQILSSRRIDFISPLPCPVSYGAVPHFSNHGCETSAMARRSRRRHRLGFCPIDRYARRLREREKRGSLDAPAARQPEFPPAGRVDTGHPQSRGCGQCREGLAQPPCAPGAERFSISLTGSRFRGIRENAP